eukprot:TRINITY_DN2093_c0_g1_i3.p1 TRINITY_DN2093_c0_g1~~TRINITY_DN2093_c0_g1_i3.p1  ORF type:complete len:183 (-),score=25.82 TRINITY_DN2093_c0_g1_i3:69-617(-)
MSWLISIFQYFFPPDETSSNSQISNPIAKPNLDQTKPVRNDWVKIVAAPPPVKKQIPEPKKQIETRNISVIRKPSSSRSFQPDPPVDSPGEWISREEFLSTTRQKKSFGWFKCTCGKSWVSAHAQPVYKQGCKGCERKRLPDLLWRNDSHEPRPSKDNRLESPHDEDRCEACRAGVCIRSGY